MAITLPVSAEALKNVSADDLASIKDSLVKFKVAPDDLEIKSDPAVAPPPHDMVTYGFPGNVLEGIGNAVGLSKCDLVSQLAYTACMGAPGGNPIACAAVAAAAKVACEG